MKKKLVAMLLVAVMVLSTLAGCGQQKEEEKQSSQPSSSEKESESEAASSEEEPVEPTTVTWVIRADPQEDDEEVMEYLNEMLRERYNLELNLIAIPGGEYNDRMNMMINSGEDYDLCYTANWANNFYDNVNKEAFLSLNDWLDSEAAEEFLAVYPEGHYEVARINGNVYAIPNYQICYSQNAWYIQKDLADKYDLGLETGDRIENAEDVRDFLEAVRDNEKDIWPLRFGGAATVPAYDKDAKQHGTTYEFVSMYKGTWDCFFSLDAPEWLELRKTMNGYYKEGFIRSDVATVVDDSADYKSNRYACYFTTGKPGGEVDTSNSMGEEYIMVYVDSTPTKGAQAGTDTMTAVNINSKNPEAALKLYSVFWTDKEIYNTFLFGIEGEHYTKVNENRVELIADSGYDRSGFGWMMGNQFNAWLLPGQDDAVWEETEAINRSAEPSQLVGFVFDQEAVATELAQLSSVKGEYDRQYIYAEDIDAWYKEYYDKLKAAGIDKVVEEYQKQINEWKAANGK